MSLFSDFSPTPKQRANLAKLATYLEALPADYQHFRMAAYYGERVSNEDDQPYL